VNTTAGNATFAAQVAQYIYDVAINSSCCQQNGYCGAQVIYRSFIICCKTLKI
jgi:hypothetical protein